MLFLRSFINLFFVPVIALYFIRKKEGKDIEQRFSDLIAYCMVVVFNIPLTRIMTLVIKVLTKMNIEADSSYYTIAAIIAAWLMPYFYRMFKRIGAELNTRLGEKEEDKK